MVAAGGSKAGRWQPVADADGGIPVGLARRQVWRVVLLCWLAASFVVIVVPVAFAVGSSLRSGHPFDLAEALSGSSAWLVFAGMYPLLWVIWPPRDRQVRVFGDGLEVRRLNGVVLVPWSAVGTIEVSDSGWLHTVRRGDGRLLAAPVSCRWLADPDFDAKVELLQAFCAAGVNQPLERRPPPPIGYLPPPPVGGWGPAPS